MVIKIASISTIIASSTADSFDCERVRRAATMIHGAYDIAIYFNLITAISSTVLKTVVDVIRISRIAGFLSTGADFSNVISTVIAITTTTVHHNRSAAACWMRNLATRKQQQMVGKRY